MQCHARVTVGTVTAPATIMAEQRVGEATAIQEDQDLLPADECLFNVTNQFGG